MEDLDVDIESLPPWKRAIVEKKRKEAEQKAKEEEEKRKGEEAKWKVRKGTTYRIDRARNNGTVRYSTPRTHTARILC